MMDFTKLRIGIGHDTHRIVDGGQLILGGVAIDFDRSLDGHSDADVLLHAVTDALLGAAAIGDIGECFPNTDEANKNRDSSEMLRIVVKQVHEARFQIVNIDCIVFAEAPKLSPYKKAIAHHLANLLEIDPSQVGVKAKTGEGLGPVGQKLAIQAQCVCLLFQTQ